MAFMGGVNNMAAGSAQRGNATGQQKEKIPKGYKKASIQQFTPEQMELLQNSISQLGPDSFLSRLAGGDQSMFEEMEAPAWRQFQEAQGELGSRFSGMGMGAGRGSGFKNAANQQSSDFAMNLQSQRMNLRNQAIKDLIGMSGQLMEQRPYQTGLTEKEPSFFDKWLGLAGRTMGAATGAAKMA